MITADAALAAAYACSGLIACGLYLPQIRTLAASAEARRAMSPATWGGWLVLGMVGIAYAGLVLHDGPMLLVTSLNSALQAVVVILALGQRAADRRARAPAASARDPADRFPATGQAG